MMRHSKRHFGFAFWLLYIYSFVYSLSSDLSFFLPPFLPSFLPSFLHELPSSVPSFLACLLPFLPFASGYANIHCKSFQQANKYSRVILKESKQFTSRRSAGGKFCLVSWNKGMNLTWHCQSFVSHPVLIQYSVLPSMEIEKGSSYREIVPKGKNFRNAKKQLSSATIARNLSWTSKLDQTELYRINFNPINPSEFFLAYSQMQGSSFFSKSASESASCIQF